MSTVARGSAVTAAAMPETISHVYTVYIRATPERIWSALTDGEQTVKFFYGGRVANYTTAGGRYQFTDPDGKTMVHGTVIESDPPRKLVSTFISSQFEEGYQTRVTYTIDPVGDSCRVTLIHEGLRSGHMMTEAIQDGWARIFSSLKSFVESGEPLALPHM